MGEREAPFHPEAEEREMPERYTLERLTVEAITTPPSWPNERLSATRVGEAVDEPALQAAIAKTVERVIEE